MTFFETLDGCMKKNLIESFYNIGVVAEALNYRGKRLKGFESHIE